MLNPTGQTTHNRPDGQGSRQARMSLEDSCECYAGLHEFAPTAYLTLTRQGVVSGMNQAAAALFGAERKKLLLRRFMDFVAPEDRDRWISCFVGILQRRALKNCELALKRGDGGIFHVRLDYPDMQFGGKTPIRIALTEVTRHKHAGMKPRIPPAAAGIIHLQLPPGIMQ